ncbi:benzaldehyde dehydrogenase [Sinomonas sp. ASV486]|uniref:benzaldehyde dehydrogenase n=1 Tax=Sinomonas sp. ASV486 TaxID=3051170 RepID=UPI0027DCDB97|nr:benzaldehyde dehydrogenase [Sinomonas sp. ASV486]MDQ4489374.1 benzaldehyde dehydrogenase [Sinomonas sp. ASV486]
MAFLDAALWGGKVNIGGWTEAGGGAFDAVEPATGATLGSVGLANRDDVYRAASLAAKSQLDWAATKPEERAAVLRRAGQLWEEHAAEVQHWLTREAGSIPAKAQIETHVAANECYEAAALPSHPHGEVLSSDEERWSFARRRPAGVVSVIAPFNFPLVLSIRSVAPALALGNAVLLKPDPRTAVCGGVTLMRIFEEAGLPAGVLSLLPGGAETGAAVVESPEVRVVSFTGSTAAGRKVGESAARLLKRAHLELGGNSALIVLPGADLAKAASAGAFGSFLHQGQICMATGRHFVHDSLYDDYVAELSAKAENLPVGDPATSEVALGPIIDEAQRDKIDCLVQDAVARGGRLTAGGSYEALFYRPTVLADLELDNPAFAVEIFGPVAPVTRFSSVDEVVEMVNASEYGLSVGILGDVGTAMKIADRVHSGKVHINEQTVSDEANAPFGGVGASGTGSRFGGATSNIDAFTEIQWLTMRSEIAPYPF